MFVFDGTAVYTPIDRKPKVTAPERLRRVRNIRSNLNVQVLVDRYDEDWRSLGFAQLWGTAAITRTWIGVSHGNRPSRSEVSAVQGASLEGRPLIRIFVEHVVTWGEIG